MARKRTRWLIGVVMLGLCAAAGHSQNQPIKPTTPALARLTPQQKKTLIIEKNVFRPARKPSMTLMSKPLNMPATDPLPKPLKRPFVVLGFVRTEANAWADLRFESPGENRRVRVGDTIESITVTGISRNYLVCDYSGKQVWLSVGETSEDALTQALGYQRDYDLIATTIQGELRFATIRLRGENRVRRVSEGDTLSDATVIRIEPGRVYLRYEDGFEHYIEPTGQSTRP